MKQVLNNKEFTACLAAGPLGSCLLIGIGSWYTWSQIATFVRAALLQHANVLGI